MKDLVYRGRIIKQADVKKLRCFRKKKLDTTNDYDIYLQFLRLMSSADYGENCKGIYLLNYMKNNKPTSVMYLPMIRFMKTGDDYFFYYKPSQNEKIV